MTSERRVRAARMPVSRPADHEGARNPGRIDREDAGAKIDPSRVLRLPQED